MPDVIQDYKSSSALSREIWELVKLLSSLLRFAQLPPRSIAHHAFLNLHGAHHSARPGFIERCTQDPNGQ
jgi:hypothetical protein